MLTSLSILFLSEQRHRQRENDEPFPLEQVKDAVEVQLDPEKSRAEVRRQLAKALVRIEHHQR